MFERFTEPARRTLFFARYEATGLGGGEIEPEHLLLGLLRADKGPTPYLFAVANLSYTEARAEIRAHWGVRQQVPMHVEIPFGGPSKRILQYAAEEADRLGQGTIGTGHLLLGLLRDEGSFAADILKRHAITSDALRQHLLDPAVVPEPEPAAPAEGNAVHVRSGPFDAMPLLEGIRMLAEELGRSTNQAEMTRSLLDQIHSHVDALKRHLARG
jgi:ATP-dependent Clp protease ATP-binding subunit ClpC